MFFLLSLRHDLEFVSGFEMAAGKTEKLIMLNKRTVVQFIASEVAFSQVDSVKQPIKRDSRMITASLCSKM